MEGWKTRDHEAAMMDGEDGLQSVERNKTVDIKLKRLRARLQRPAAVDCHRMSLVELVSLFHG